MIKTIAIVLFAIVIIIALFVGYLWWNTLKQPPAYTQIVEKYYVCKKHRILHGGIFGKGPTRKYFKSNGREWCWKWEWEEIDRKTFKGLATDWYGVDWSKEVPYWH